MSNELGSAMIRATESGQDPPKDDVRATSTTSAGEATQQSARNAPLESTTQLTQKNASFGPELCQGIDAPLEVGRVLGQGGMGTVYLAFDPLLSRDVALKELSPTLAQSESYRSGFLAEARVNARLDHPGIVQVHALQVGPGPSLSFTMQVVNGENFQSWMARPEYPVGSRQRLECGLEIFLKICDALAYAHSRKVLHCDVKPQNVMVGDFGTCYLMDWGLARPLVSDPPLAVCGTPAYMAPEQARNEPLDERADVFGLGAMLFELATGRTPYASREPHLCQAHAANGDVDDVLAIGATVGASLPICRIVERAVAPRREDRYQTVMELRHAVRSFIRDGFYLAQRTFERGEIIVCEGEEGDTAYLLVSGRCRVFRRIGGAESTLRHIGPGEVFGELSLLLDTSRTASVEAEEDCTVLVIDRATIESSGALEGWTAALVRVLAQRFRELELRLLG